MYNGTTVTVTVCRTKHNTVHDRYNNDTTVIVIIISDQYRSVVIRNDHRLSVLAGYDCTGVDHDKMKGPLAKRRRHSLPFVQTPSTVVVGRVYHQS